MRSGHLASGHEGLGELESWVGLPFLGTWTFLFGENYRLFPEKKYKHVYMHLPSPQNTHTFSYNFKELIESMNPRREPLNDRKSYVFCTLSYNKYY